MININEKREITPRDREHIIFALDKAYEQCEPLAMHLNLFDEFEYTIQQRNEIILASDYKNNQELVSMLVLFG